jgi:hypothetical protein
MLLHCSHLLQAFKAVFEVPAWRAACEGAAGGIRAILKTYKEVLDHLSEGLRFYMSLQVGAKLKMSLLPSFSAAAAAFSSSCCLASEGLRFYMSLQVGAKLKMSLLPSFSAAAAAAAAAFSSSCCLASEGLRFYMSLQVGAKFKLKEATVVIMTGIVVTIATSSSQLESVSSSALLQNKLSSARSSA